MEILKVLIPSNQNQFILPYITINETILLIKQLKSSNSTGHDDISSKILKKIGSEIAPHITHLINSIIKTSIYPEIFKISKINPVCKPDKNPNLIESYRPINNLPIIEKLIQEHIKIHLILFLDNNKIINENQHGVDFLLNNHSCF